MSQPHRAEHRQSEGDYYAQKQREVQQGTRNFGSEDRSEAREGVAAQTQKAASEYSVSQGQQLLQGQTPRGDAPAPNQNLQANTHQQLYDMVHTDLVIGDMNDRSNVTNSFGNWLADASNAFNDAATTAGGEWQGDAATKANGFFQQTASHAEHTGNAVQLSSNHYSQQSAAAHYAQTNMPEPTNFDQKAEQDKATQQIASGDLVGGITTNNAIAAKQQKADADHQRAAEIVQGLDNTYHGTATTQPTYTPMQQPGQHSDSTTASGFDGGNVSGHTGGPGSGPGTPGTGGWSPGNQPGVGAVPPGAGGQQPPFPGGNSYVAPGNNTGTGLPNSPLGGRLGGPAMGTNLPRFGPDGMAISGTGGGVGNAGGDTVRGGRSAPGGGGRGFAGSRVSGGGYTPGKTGGAESEPGKGSGSGAGKAAGERIARGGVAAANAKGAAGAGGAGAGAGKKKEEDKEHKNKTPTQVDPDEVFEPRPEYGPDGQKATPPVIGG